MAVNKKKTNNVANIHTAKSMCEAAHNDARCTFSLLKHLIKILGGAAKRVSCILRRLFASATKKGRNILAIRLKIAL